jgi:hypothetical protein
MTESQGTQNPEKRSGHPRVIEAVMQATLAPITLAAKATSRMNFSVQHLLAAARLAEEVDAVETANAGAEFGPFYDVILGSSVGCIVLASAALEAYVNEVFADRSKHFSAGDQMLLDLLWGEYEQKRVLDKFDLALRLKIGTALDRGTSTTQAADRLIRLRNALTHFKPEWFDDPDEHAKLSEKLEGYVGRSPWLPNEPLFPRAWATRSTTSWAISTVVAFIARFSADSGILDRVAKFSDRLSTAREKE